ncbi:MAG: hypothetical protein QM711_14895 [Micropruina sp.]|uniref:hypothetical protein n=1 Tax=Micropruina sp. TaxID=2737536 RepID=UPI0039E65FED
MTQQVERMLPLYEAKMVGAFNHRAADVVKSVTAVKRQNQPSYLPDAALADPNRLAYPASWVHEDVIPENALACRLGFLRISSPTNARTLISSILPNVAAGDSVFLMNCEDEEAAILLAAQMNSFALDYVVRQKLAGLNLNFFYVEQFPFLAPDVFKRRAPWADMSLDHWMIERVLPLVLTAVDMQALVVVVGGGVAAWNLDSRQLLSAEIDAAMFHLFTLSRIDVDYILDTFPIVKRKDEAAFGTFRTKDLILQVYDAMQTAIDSGETYASPFDRESSVAPTTEWRETR